MSDFLKKINYLFTPKLKVKFVMMIVIILIGSLFELLGVSIILPVVNLATEPEAVSTNSWCIGISEITGVSEPLSVLVILIVAVIVIYIVKNVYLTFMSFMVNKFAKDTRMFFSTKLLKAYMKQPYCFFLNKNSSELIRSVNNDTSNLYTLLANLLNVVSYVVTATLIIGYLAITNLIMTLVVAGVLVICLALIMFVIKKKITKMGKEVQRLDGEIIRHARQAFEGIKEVKILNREKYFIEKYRDVYDKKNTVELVYNLLNYIPKYLIETICIVGIMGYLLVAILKGGDLAEMVTQLAVFAVAAFRLLPSMNQFFTAFTAFLYNKASLDIIYRDILSVENVADEVFYEKDGEKFTFKNELRVENLVFSYENSKKKILDDVSIIIRKGESVAFVGESGGGKTTLVDIIIGILFPQGGRVLSDGQDVASDIRAWHRNIGYIPQNIFLMDDTIRRNIAFGVEDEEIEDERVWIALEKAQLGDFVRELPNGLDTKTGEAGARLSGGQRQRIGIARALYYNPEILVFDEATSALDTETEKEVMNAIENLHGEKTMLMIAHRLSTIEKCERVYRVENGKVMVVRG